MTPLKTLDLMIGMAALYSLFSVFCSMIVEWVAATRKRRSRELERAFCDLLGKDIGTAVYTHPLVTTSQGTRRPSVVPANVFSTALVAVCYHITKEGSLKTATPRSAIAGTETVIPPRERRLLESLCALDVTSLQVEQRIERWYESAMARVRGQYKRTTQWITGGVALAVVFGFHLSAVQAWRSMRDSGTIQTIVAATPPTRSDSSVAGTYEKTLSQISLPLGWGDTSPETMLEAIVGMLISWLALMMGAPFWFDTLNRFVGFKLNGQQPGGTTASALRA